MTAEKPKDVITTEIQGSTDEKTYPESIVSLFNNYNDVTLCD